MELKPDTAKLERNCIVCGDTRHSDMFRFTYDFLRDVRGHSETMLELRDWTPETTSTIVKCSSCGANFIRDVVRQSGDVEIGHDDRFLDEEERKVWLDRFSSAFKRASVNRHREQRAILDALINQVYSNASETGKELSFLEFGAAKGEFAFIAGALGINHTVAYDVGYPTDVQEMFDITHPLGTVASRSFEEIKKQGPFNIAVCQSVIEHVFDPKRELQRMRSVMAEGGVLYINNPLMDLDAEIGLMNNATKITKADNISHYHPLHLNYLTPNQFGQLLRSVGFELVGSFIHHTNAEVGLATTSTLNRYLRDAAHYMVDSTGLIFRRQLFVAKAV